MKIVVAASYGESLVNFRGEFIKALIGRKHEVVCISCERDPEIITRVQALGADYYYVPMKRTSTNVLSDILTVVSFIRVLKRIKPDVYFAYMAKPIAYGGLAAKLCKIKTINVLVTGLEVAFYSSGFKNCIVRTVLKILFRSVHKSSANVLFQNPDDMSEFIKLGIASSEQSSLVNGSGVDMSFFVKKPFPRHDTVLMVGRLVWSKGIREYIQAAQIVRAKHPKVRFQLVGGLDENPEALSREELDVYIKSNIIEYCGYQRDVRPYLEQCSLFVLPSYHEGTPRCVLEAMAVGRPIVTTDVPGCKETVVENINGFLVPARNPDKLAERITWLIEHRYESKKMGEASYEICKEKYDVRKVNSAMLNIMNL